MLWHAAICDMLNPVKNYYRILDISCLLVGDILKDAGLFFVDLTKHLLVTYKSMLQNILLVLFIMTYVSPFWIIFIFDVISENIGYV